MKRPWQNISLASAILVGICIWNADSYASDPIISNLSVAQRPGTNLVDITYDLAASSSVTVSVEIATNWYTRWMIAASNFTGDGFGANVTPGTGRKIVWDAGADWPGQFSTDVWFKVTADNGWCPRGFSMIPSGMFVMGDPFKDYYDGDDWYLHSVYISAFYMSQTEVSKAEWDNVYKWARSNGYTFDNGGTGKATNHPVFNVNWYDCVKWCNARSEKEGLGPCYYTTADQTEVYRTGQVDLVSGCVNWGTNGYRLPTEAEWEKTGRGGVAGNRFPWGDVDTITHSQANYCSDSYENYDISPTRGYHPLYNDGSWLYTSPVGSFSPNGYGLYDMAGNVNEWCWDRDGNGPWYSDPRASQADTRGPPDGGLRRFRSGSWQDCAIYCRVAGRDYDEPLASSISSHDMGFRCARGRSISVCGGLTVDTGGPRPYGKVQLTGTNAITHDSARRVTIQVSRANGTYGVASVRYATANATATSGVDYTATSGQLTWANGEGDTKTITVPVIYRCGIQGPRSFNLTLSDVTGAASGSPTQTVVNIQDSQAVFNDYDGDGCSDLAVYDDANGLWYIISAQGAVIAWAVHWGFPGARLVPGDYDGDGIADLAAYDEQTGKWYIWSLANYVGGQQSDFAEAATTDKSAFHNQGSKIQNQKSGHPIAWAFYWGGPGLKPVRGDYDGDGISDMAVYYEQDGLWYIINMQGQQIAWAEPWGGIGYEPVWGDYDGDMRDDLTVYDTRIIYDQNIGKWYSRTMSGSVLAWAIHWDGVNTLMPVPGDFDGDQLCDLSEYSESSTIWYLYRLNGTYITSKEWSVTGLLPVPGDYDGDMRSDMAVFNEATASWAIWSLSRGLILDGFAWGWPGCTVVGAVGSEQ